MVKELLGKNKNKCKKKNKKTRKNLVNIRTPGREGVQG